MQWNISLLSFRKFFSRWTHDAIITSLWSRSDVATSFWRDNDVIIAACALWVTYPDSKVHGANMGSIMLAPWALLSGLWMKDCPTTFFLQQWKLRNLSKKITILKGLKDARLMILLSTELISFQIENCVTSDWSNRFHIVSEKITEDLYEIDLSPPTIFQCQHHAEGF